jgi:hypothetical protein
LLSQPERIRMVIKGGESAKDLLRLASDVAR